MQEEKLSNFVSHMQNSQQPFNVSCGSTRLSILPLYHSVYSLKTTVQLCTINLWNILNLDIVSCPTLYSFKKLLYSSVFVTCFCHPQLFVHNCIYLFFGFIVLSSPGYFVHPCTCRKWYKEKYYTLSKCNVMFGALGSISDQNFYMCMQSLEKC